MAELLKEMALSKDIFYHTNFGDMAILIFTVIVFYLENAYTFLRANPHCSHFLRQNIPLFAIVITEINNCIS